MTFTHFPGCPNEPAGANAPQEAVDLLLDCSMGEMDAGRAAVVARMTAACTGCAEIVTVQKALWTSLDAWEAPEISADFNRRLYQAMGETKVSFWSRFTSFGLSQWLTPGTLVPAGALAVLLAGILVTQVQRPELVEQKAALEKIDGTQVERALDDLEVLSTIDEIIGPEGGGKAL